MKKVIALAAVLSLGVSSLAFAQTMDNTTNGSTNAASGNSAMGSAPMGTGTMGPSTGTPSTMGSASTTATPPTGSQMQAVTNTQPSVIPSPGSATTVPTMSGKAAGNLPLKGANSFTEKEATRRLEKRGYTNIAGLSKDDAGVWRGTATNKSSKSVSVALDYKGRITETQ